MGKNINKAFYRYFVKGFCEKLQQIPNEYHPESGIFIPYTFNNYAKAEKKIFFVGIDSAGWIKTSEMLNDYSNNDIDSYLEKNSKVVTVQGKNQDGTDCHSLKENSSWNRDLMSCFWPFCQKLYIYIITGEWVDIAKFEQRHYDLLEGAAYGNQSLVEIKKGWLEKVHKYKGNSKLVKELHTYVNEMEKLENIFNAYDVPDLVIILGQRGRRDILNGLGATLINSNEYADVFDMERYPTKIIWTSHPSARKKRAFRQEILPALGDTARKLLGLIE